VSASLQNTGSANSQSKTEKDSLKKGKHRETGKEKSNLLYGENLYTRAFSTESLLMTKTSINEFRLELPTLENQICMKIRPNQ
jgi:hypothetical protein